MSEIIDRAWRQYAAMREAHGRAALEWKIGHDTMTQLRRALDPYDPALRLGASGDYELFGLPVARVAGDVLHLERVQPARIDEEDNQ